MPFDMIPAGLAKAPDYPGRVVKRDESDAQLVKLVQQRLNDTGCGPIDVDGVFDRKNTESAVKLFQARYSDVTGRPLVVDGKIGPLTWGAIFGASTVPTHRDAPSSLIDAVLHVARGEVGVMEQPLSSNRGPRVDEYLTSVGLPLTPGGHFWCVAFTYFCFQTAAASVGRANPHVPTAGVLDHWNKSQKVRGARRIAHAAATNNPDLVRPGQLFVMDYGDWKGHTGLVLEVANGRLTTIEGNTNDDGSRNGIGVFRREGRKIVSINKGFIDYSEA